METSGIFNLVKLWVNEDWNGIMWKHKRILQIRKTVEFIESF